MMKPDGPAWNRGDRHDMHKRMVINRRGQIRDKKLLFGFSQDPWDL